MISEMLEENTFVQPPHSREAEEAVVGAALINPEVMLELRDLKPEEFYIVRLRFVWQACLSLIENHQPIDQLTVCEKLAEKGRLDEVGGPAFLTSLLNRVPSSLHAENYAEIVHERAKRRRLLAIANKIATSAHDYDLDASAITDDALKAIRAAEMNGSADDSKTIGQLVDEIYEAARSRYLNGVSPSRRVATEWTLINEYLGGGFAPGKLYVIAGRPGDGKSTWLANAAYYAARSKVKVGFFSLEMEQLEIVSRIMAARTRLNANLITDGKIVSEEAWAAMQTALVETQSAAMRLEYTPGLSPARLRAKAYRMQQISGLDMLVVDYLQLMSGDSRAANRQEEVSALSRELKILAGELRIPVIVAAQLNRAVEQRENREPQLSDLRESGAIENDADVVAFLWRQNPESTLSAVKFAKNRGGRTGVVPVNFDAEFFTFVEPK